MFYVKSLIVYSVFPIEGLDKLWTLQGALTSIAQSRLRFCLKDYETMERNLDKAVNLLEAIDAKAK